MADYTVRGFASPPPNALMGGVLGNTNQGNALLDDWFMPPRRSDTLLDLWHATQGQPTMRAAEPRFFSDKAASAVSSGLEAAGLDGRSAADYGHRAGGLASMALSPLSFAHDVGALYGEGVRDDQPAKSAAALLMGGAGAAVPYAARAMTRLPSFEAVRDASMASQLAGAGPTPAAFATPWSKPVSGPLSDAWYGNLQVRSYAPSGVDTYSRGRTLDELRRSTPANANALASPEDLRRLFRVVE